jgi:serine phosphatase RsbU (regulator of sigma subunit)/class 3 adenylate cyclase/tetratricopeptide (TPR) repeat protein
MQCPRCQTENPSAARFCLNCGTPLNRRCENCQSDLAIDARFCMFCGHPVRMVTADDVARHNRLAAAAPVRLAEKARAGTLSGERRIATVLFADVVGSTNLAQQVDVETWTSIMNGAFDRITPVVYRYEGTIARLLGDSLVAFFGAPVAHEDDPLRAVRAALESLEAVKAYAAEFRQKFGIDFAMRFCLNTGQVVVGQIGKDLRYEFSATGGAVNLAARLKFISQPMTVLISEHTYRFVSPVFDCTDLGWIEVKDLTEPLRVYQVNGLQAEPGSLRGLAGLESPMVGRDAQLKTLLKLCEAVQAGLGRAVLIVGEPGLGKSRLIAEWQAAVAATTSSILPQWATGHSLSYGQEMPYHLVLELLRSLLGVPDTAPDQEARAALLGLVADYIGSGEEDAGGTITAYLGHLLGLDMGARAKELLKGVDAEALQAQYLVAMRKLLHALAGQRPLVLILEDLHWADPSSVEMLTRLIPQMLNSPVLFCLVTRPERESQGWKLVSLARELLGSSLTELVLEALSEQDSRQLVANLLEIEALPENLRSLILQNAEGNPFFVEEIVRMLIERQAILRSGDGWVAGEQIGNLQIPDNLQGLLLARIDRLSDQSKQALRVASVVGRQFPVKVLAEVLGGDPESEDPDGENSLSILNSLESAGLIRMAQIQPDLEYLFRHSLVQEAAYGSLLSTDRKRLHREVGEAVENLYSDRLHSRELAPRLGLHFSEAGDVRRALKYFTIAGEAALESYANQEAEIHIRRAMELSQEDAQCARLMTELGEALARQSRYEDALQVWKEGIQLYQGLANQEGLARLYALSARAAWWSGDHQRSLNLAEEGLAQVAGAPESAEFARLVHEVGRAHYFNGNPDEAARLCQQSLEMAERLGAVDVQADALITIGILPGQPEEVVFEVLTRGVELAESAGLLITAHRGHINLSSAKRTFMGDSQAGREHVLRALEISRHRGVPQEELFVLITLVSTSLELGEFSVAEDYIEQMKRLLPGISDSGQAEMEIQVLSAAIQGMRGGWAEAIEQFRKSITETRERGDLQNLVNYNGFLATASFELHSLGESVDWDEVGRAIQEEIELGKRGFKKVDPLIQLARLRIVQKRFIEAREILDQAQREANQDPSIWYEIAFARAEAELASSLGNWDKVIDIYQSGVEFCARCSQRWPWARMLFEWADALVQRGDPADLERARGLYLESSARFQEMGARFYVDLLQSRLQALERMAQAQGVAHGEVTREMAQAKRIQASFLPGEMPDLPGWSLAARLEPARATSGDFYDLFLQPDGKLCLVTADVADKGAGAALFMASSRTLLRAYADEFPGQPERVIAATNRRLLSDTRAGLFVTAFFAVLDPDSGTLVYCNAGHNPAYLVRCDGSGKVQLLPRTGIPVGVLEEAAWERGAALIEPGDVLVIYTDGLTEAQNTDGDYFGEAGLRESLLALCQVSSGEVPSAPEILNGLLAEIHQFVGSRPLGDDLTILVLGRI